MEIRRAFVKTGVIISHESKCMGLTESEQRELLVWFKNNKPELLHELIQQFPEVFLGDCPDCTDYNQYCENKVERRK